MYKYVVRIINRKWKREYIVWNWHHMHENFTSPENIKVKLRDSFREYIPDNMTFKIGYFEKPGSSKRWLETVEDVQAMYINNTDEMFTLWCDGRSNEQMPKYKNTCDNNTSENKQTKKENYIETSFRSLRKKQWPIQWSPASSLGTNVCKWSAYRFVKAT